MLRLLSTLPVHTAFVPRGEDRNGGHAFPDDDRLAVDGVEIYDRDANVMYEVVAERRDGKPECLRYTVTPARIVQMSAADLLQPAFLAQVAVAYLEAVASGEHDPSDVYRPDPGQPLDEPSRALWTAEIASGASQSRRIRRPSLEWIARTYRDATLDPHSKAPRHVIAAVHNVSLELADRWIAATRSAGMLPPATRAQGARGGGRPRKTTKGTDQR